MTPEFRISEPQLISLFQHIFSVCLVDIFIVSNLPYLKLVPPRYYFSSNEWSHNFSNLPSSNSPHMTSLLSSHTVFVRSSKHFGLVASSTPSCRVFTASTLTYFGQWDISRWETSKALLSTCMLGFTLLKCSCAQSAPTCPSQTYEGRNHLEHFNTSTHQGKQKTAKPSPHGTTKTNTKLLLF